MATHSDQTNRVAGQSSRLPRLPYKQRLAAAENPDTDEETVRDLARDTSDKVRTALAGRTNLPLDIACVLASDTCQSVRFRLAMKENTPADVLRLLAEDIDVDVLIRVAKHRQTPEDVLSRLVGKDHCMQKARGWDSVMVVIAANPNAGTALLTTLAKHKKSYVRASVAENPATPAHLFEQMAAEDGYVSQIIARRPDISVERLCWMAAHRCGGKYMARERLEAFMREPVEQSLSGAPPTFEPQLQELLDRAWSAQQTYVRARTALIESLNLPKDSVPNETLNNLEEITGRRACTKKLKRWDRDACPWFMEVRIENLGLSLRTINCLSHHNCKTVADLAKISTAELLAIQNFGRKCLNEVEDLLDMQFGIRLPGSDRPAL